MQRAVHLPAVPELGSVHSVANAARIVVGVGFVAAAAYNAANGIADFTAYHDFAADSWLPGYADAWANLIVPVLPMAILLLVLFELAVAALVLGSGREVRFGLGVATVFVLALVPANTQTLANIPLAAVFVVLALPRYEGSVWRRLAGLGHR